ncbi:C-terminal processing peptidase-3 [Syntrophobotulus glycolicus DSM 8271]|uniref:C-terminal processing peptidase-3 n=1 Tax=Syntrophobotulus glycolicus (strain DSM 8271 / FlGlyR) TaxID=645991 RepID=F0T283_SYNGF|nr:S41 family peptidase [Syntrophobotulus glycolicus]ADY57511.1 C-terminal processing peptidase-3 [Syntrophobotulus glycolicus DSM 8271]
MSDKTKWLRAFKQAAVVGLILCLVIVLAVAGLAMTNYKHLGRLVAVVHLIETQYLNGASGEELVDGAIKGMLSSLDPYSSFQNEEENTILMNSIQGRIGGVGVHISTADPQKLVIMRAVKNSPAEKAGLEAGDIIYKIDSTEVSAISQDQAIAILRGEPGTQVTVGVVRPKTNSEFNVTMTREYIDVPTVEGEILPGSSGIGLINIASFSAQTGDEFEKVVKELLAKNCQGLIIDLRYNYGGEVNAAVKVASMLVPQGPIVHIVDNQGKTETKQSTAQYLNLPFVVLTNEYTASASEIVSGAVKDYGTGTLIGQKTYGKGVVQTVFQLDSMTSVKLTTDKYLTPNKNDIHKIGIEPDIAVQLKEGEKPTILPSDNKLDTQLQKAAEVIRSKMKS